MIFSIAPRPRTLFSYISHSYRNGRSSAPLCIPHGSFVVLTIVKLLLQAPCEFGVEEGLPLGRGKLLGVLPASGHVAVLCVL